MEDVAVGADRHRIRRCSRPGLWFTWMPLAVDAGARAAYEVPVPADADFRRVAVVAEDLRPADVDLQDVFDRPSPTTAAGSRCR